MSHWFNAAGRNAFARDGLIEFSEATKVAVETEADAARTGAMNGRFADDNATLGFKARARFNASVAACDISSWLFIR